MIPLAKPDISAKEIKGVVDVLESGILSLGQKLKEFEQQFSAVIGTSFAVGVNSGTSGLHLCIKALGIKDGDEVITTPFSFVASANCILYERATPVFVDVEEDTFNINPDLIEKAITPRTKAILIVHVFGQSCDMDKIVEIARKHNLKIIEDACEALFGSYRGRNIGTFGDAAVFAFYPNKQITTGEGGMIVTDNKQIADYCRSAANQGRSSNLQWLTHDIIGYNYRMDEMSSALGLAQLSRIDSISGKRRMIAEHYIRELSSIPGLILPKVYPESQSGWFVFAVRTRAAIRDNVIRKLQEKGIQSKAYFYPCIHLQPAYIQLFGYQEGMFPVAEKLSKETMVLPFYTALEEKDILAVKQALTESMAELQG